MADAKLSQQRRMQQSEEACRPRGGPEPDPCISAQPDTDDSIYRALVESMNEGAAVLAGDGTIWFCNPHFLQMARSSRSQLVGARFQDCLAPVGQAAFEALLGAAEQGQA